MVIRSGRATIDSSGSYSPSSAPSSPSTDLKPIKDVSGKNLKSSVGSSQADAQMKEASRIVKQKGGIKGNLSPILDVAGKPLTASVGSSQADAQMKEASMQVRQTSRNQEIKQALSQEGFREQAFISLPTYNTNTLPLTTGTFFGAAAGFPGEFLGFLRGEQRFSDTFSSLRGRGEVKANKEVTNPGLLNLFERGRGSFDKGTIIQQDFAPEEQLITYGQAQALSDVASGLNPTILTKKAQLLELAGRTEAQIRPTFEAKAGSATSEAELKKINEDFQQEFSKEFSLRNQRARLGLGLNEGATSGDVVANILPSAVETGALIGAFTTPVGAVAASGVLVGSSSKQFGKAVLGEDLSFSQRTGLLAGGAIQAGIGLAGFSSVANVATGKSVLSLQARREVEQELLSTNFATIGGERLGKNNLGELYKLTATRQTGFASQEVDTLVPTFDIGLGRATGVRTVVNTRVVDPLSGKLFKSIERFSGGAKITGTGSTSLSLGGGEATLEGIQGSVGTGTLRNIKREGFQEFKFGNVIQKTDEGFNLISLSPRNARLSPGKISVGGEVTGLGKIRTIQRLDKGVSLNLQESVSPPRINRNSLIDEKTVVKQLTREKAPPSVGGALKITQESANQAIVSSESKEILGGIRNIGRSVFKSETKELQKNIGRSSTTLLSRQNELQKSKQVLSVVNPSAFKVSEITKQSPRLSTVLNTGLGQRSSQATTTILGGSGSGAGFDFGSPGTFGGFPLFPSVGLSSKPGRGNALIGKFSPRFTPSLTSIAFDIRGVVPKRFRMGEVDPFSRRVIPKRRRR